MCVLVCLIIVCTFPPPSIFFFFFCMSMLVCLLYAYKHPCLFFFIPTTLVSLKCIVSQFMILPPFPLLLIACLYLISEQRM